MMRPVNNKVYRPCVGLALFNEDGRVFLGERIDTPGAWQMPQGGIDKNEDIKAAAMRELAEEIGTNNAAILHILPEKVRYDLPADMLQKLWGGRYAGQEQTWVVLKFLGQDKDINLIAFDPPEFSRWKWASLDEAAEMIVPFKRETYKIITERLKAIKI